jgi:preprotein translocase subunit SecY
VLDFFNMFSGGALERMSLIALGVMPYITASIVVQLLASLIPALMALKKEGESGRKKLNQYTRYGTVFLTAIQGYGSSPSALRAGAREQGCRRWSIRAVVPVSAVISLIGGTMFLLWLGEQITSRGIGNGVSLIIMAGIVAQLPTFVWATCSKAAAPARSRPADRRLLSARRPDPAFICFMERAQRRLLIQYPKRASGQRGMMQADRSHLPLKINTAGVIPPIFASSLLLLPLTISQFAGNSGGHRQHGLWL